MFALKKLFGGSQPKNNQASSKNSNSSKSSKKKSSYFRELEEGQDSGSPASNLPKSTKEKAEPFVEKAAEPNKVTTEDRKPVKTPNAPVQILEEKIPTSVEKVATSSNNGKVDPQASTFAPKYLTPSTVKPRRRPGPSMEMFKSMARQANIPNTK